MLRIRLGNHLHTALLCEFLRGAGVGVERTSDPDLLSAWLPGAPSPEHERRELTQYVETWLRLNPGAEAEVARAAY